MTKKMCHLCKKVKICFLILIAVCISGLYTAFQCFVELVASQTLALHKAENYVPDSLGKCLK